VIHDLDDHARRLGFKDRASMEAVAEGLSKVLAHRLRSSSVSPQVAFERWRLRVRELQGGHDL
jgi:hypothetical protein